MCSIMMTSSQANESASISIYGDKTKMCKIRLSVVRLESDRGCMRADLGECRVYLRRMRGPLKAGGRSISRV